MERKNGILRYYDPQNGRVIDDFIKYIDGIDFKGGLRYLRVDNLRVNPEVAKNVLTKRTVVAKSAEVTNNIAIGSHDFKKVLEIRKQALTSGRFVVDKTPKIVLELKTGEILQSKKTLNRLIQHCTSESEINAAEYIWTHLHEMQHIRISPLGEGKDMSLTKNINNIQNKVKRGIIQYHEYEFKYNGAVWSVKTEETKYGFEQLYFLKKK